MTRTWKLRDRSLALDRPLVMGILNVTPDSFSDGGAFLDPEAAARRALELEAQGADILDVGGESTRPGAAPVPSPEELRRVLPVLERLRGRLRIPVSVDTRRAAVAQEVLDAGAHAINDVSALEDPAMAGVVARAGAGLVLMHMRGDPATMQRAPAYADVVAEVRGFLAERARRALDAGVPREAIVVDPGLGFGKRTGAGIEDNLVLLKHLSTFSDLGYPILVGASRKSFIGNVLKLPVHDRLEGSLAAAAVAVWNGATIVRAHDVRSTRRLVDVVQAVRSA